MTKRVRDKVLMMKSLKEVNNVWEALAFIMTFRQREAWRIIAMIEFAILVALLSRYTDFFNIVFKKILPM